VLCCVCKLKQMTDYETDTINNKNVV
jgi:hypothetical protein